MKVLIVATCLLAVASAGFVGHHGYAGHLAGVSPLAYAGHYGGLYGAHYAGPQHIPVIGADGIPVDTPAVAAAKAGHAVAHATTAARDAHVNGVAYSAGLGHAGVVGAHGVPLDTPAVVAARASHAAAHAATAVRDAHFAVAPVALAAHGLVAGHYGYAHGVAPVAHGVVVDTPAVAHARAAHLAAHAAVAATHGHYAHHY